MKRQVRFQTADGRWTRWFYDGEDLSFLKGNTEVKAVEVSEEMTREEFERQFPGQIPS